ncbi:RagB/SusD family nutrient uptake outer membrane protein [Urechidicola sp. KH5]
MKNKIFYIAFALLGIVSCSEEFSETPAYGALSADALQNEQGINLMLIGAYSLLDGNSNTGGSDYARAADGWWLDVMSDDAHKGSTNGDQPDLYDFEIMNWTTTNGYLDAKWKGLYAGVNRANAVIDLISRVQEGDFTQQLAEARFLRGHFNFELVKVFHNVAYISEQNFADVEFNQPNTGPIWDEIEADFDFAVRNLPDTQSDVGRPTNWAATAFLGKVHLFQGEYTEALGYLTTVINLGPYQLLTEYADNFRLAGDNSSESVFAIQFTADGGLSYNGNIGGTLNYPGPINCCGFYQPTQDLVNAYQTDGSGLPLLDDYANNTVPDVANDYGITSAQPFVPHAGPLDPRLDYTVGRRGIEYNGYGVHPGKDWVRSNFSDLSGPYTPKKNVYQADESANMGAGAWGEQRSGINYHFMRYSDVLLMAAEAAVETNDIPNALTWVNMVRDRARLMTYVSNDGGATPAANYQIEAYPSFPDQEYARRAVRMERRLEFGMEGHRLFDIRRWNVAGTTMSNYFVNEGRTVTSFAGLPAAYENKHDLAPIPVGAIDLSGGILNQNPGY